MAKFRIYQALLLAICCIPVSAQKDVQTFYYGASGRLLDGPENARQYKELVSRSEQRLILKTYRLEGKDWEPAGKEKIRRRGNGELVIYFSSDGIFPDRIYRKMEEAAPGTYQFTESALNGLLRKGTTSRFLPLHLEGTVVEYHPDGKVKTRSVFHDNQLIANENWLADGTPYIDSIFFSADQEPEYQNGNDFFKNYILQQLMLHKIDLGQIEDQVIIGFVIMETGNIDGVIALKGKSRGLNQLLTEIIAGLPGYWQPAVLDGSPVRYFMQIPLNFMQREARFQELDFSSGTLHYSKY